MKFYRFQRTDKTPFLQDKGVATEVYALYVEAEDMSNAESIAYCSNFQINLNESFYDERVEDWQRLWVMCNYRTFSESDIAKEHVEARPEDAHVILYANGEVLWQYVT